MAIIFLPEHALLGISIKPKKQESVFIYQDQDYFYLEPTGPALFEIGEISSESQRAIDNNQHQFEPVSS